MFAYSNTNTIFLQNQTFRVSVYQAKPAGLFRAGQIDEREYGASALLRERRAMAREAISRSLARSMEKMWATITETGNLYGVMRAKKISSRCAPR